MTKEPSPKERQIVGKKKNIALFMAMLENDFSSSILQGASRGAKEFDANLTVFPMDLINAVYAVEETNQYKYQYNTLASFMNCSTFDGVIVEYGTIVSSLPAEKKSAFLSKINNDRVYLLAEEAEGYASLCVHNDVGLREVIEHLILDHHYTKIGYLSGTKDNRDAEERRSVFIETTKKHNLYLGEDWIAQGNFSEYVENEVTELINKHPDIEAIVCANDGMAMGAIKAASKLGRVPGKDIFITGFDNAISGFLNDPAITTVKADPSELAYQAVKELIKPKFVCKQKYINTKMIKRESCGCHSFKLDKAWKDNLGISSDWRKVAQFQMAERYARRGLEHELGNVTREIVFATDTELGRYEAIIKTMRRLGIQSSSLILYDRFIEHNRDEDWIIPDRLNMVGCYLDINDETNYIYKKGELLVSTEELFANPMYNNGVRHEAMVIPLFFGNKQMGLLVSESDISKYTFVHDMAGQISNTLYITAINDEQERMRKELIAANMHKSQFLANMSHEIRTPINAIIGFDEMILRESKDLTISDYATDVKNAADALLLLVNDVLDFSKIEAGKMELVCDEYSLLQFLNGIVSIVKTRAEKKGLELVLKYDETMPSKLYGDSGRMQQIMLNLISNAIKYTNEGTVTIEVGGNTDNDIFNLVVKVKDTGIGIKKTDIARLFNKFERIEEKRNRNIEGTGLGINITAGLLEIMESKLEVKSKYGAGSEFSFVVKQKIIDKSSIKDTRQITMKSASEDKARGIGFEAPDVRVLVVDDNAINRKVICSLLKNTKMTIDQAEGGKKCIELVQDNVYDLVLLDHMMPEMDGIETLNKLLKDKILDINKTPVIVLTANAIAGAKEEYLKLGFTDYLAKPVRPKDLYAMLKEYISEDKIFSI